MGRTNIIIPTPTSKDIERFWKCVDKNGPIPELYPELGNCWLWTGNREREGYGYFWLQGHEIGAHRISYFIQTGKRPDPALVIMHLCDVRKCQVHLKEDSQARNMEDAKKKGRMAAGERHNSKLHPELIPKGDGHYESKLTAEIVQRLREQYSQGKGNIYLWADQYDITPQNIHAAIIGKTWKSVPGAVSVGTRNRKIQ